MQPHRSKALIITFIITLILLIAGYFLFVKGDALKGNSSILGKKFNPILGTPKQKDVIVNEEEKKPDVIVPPDTTSPTPPNDTDTTNAGSNKGGTGAVQPIPKFIPPNMTFPQPKNSPFTPRDVARTQCADGIDNDKDGSIDSSDNDCHSDGNANNLSTYVSTYNREAGSKNAPIVPEENKKVSCDITEIPLEFTAEEQAELDELTRQFYRLAPHLKTENDVMGEVSSYDGYVTLIDSTKDLIKQCREQTSTPEYLRNDIDQQTLGLNLGIKSGLVFASGQDCTTNPEMCEDKGKELFMGYVIDDGVGVRQYDTYNFEGWSWGQGCWTNPELCHGENRTYYGVKDVLISLKNKGRIERLRNPYYDSSKEQYPFEETASYYIQYFLDPRPYGEYNSKDINLRYSQTGLYKWVHIKPRKDWPYIWIYRDNEKSWQVW